MKLLTYLLLAVGVVLFVVLLMHYGVSEVLAGAAAAGWGLLWVTLYRFVNLAADAQGWRALFERLRPAFLPMLNYRWIGEAVNSMLPVGQVGGDVVRARLATRLGPGGAQAGAATVVDFTLGLMTQFLTALLAVGLLIQARGFGRETQAWLAGLLVAVVVVAAFWAAQHLQMFGRAARLGGRVLRGGAWESLTGGAAALDSEVKATYRRHRALAECTAWRLVSWLLHAGETWLVLWFLDAPVGLVVALILESLSTAVRSGAFAVPGALGVQEGGFVLLGPMVGVSAETALALSLVKRFRELVIGCAGLLAWMALEHASLAKLVRKSL